jgi:hypothetical protein
MARNRPYNMNGRKRPKLSTRAALLSKVESDAGQNLK